MTFFKALPVGQGDAFYLEDEQMNVLVDGGLAREGFPHTFSNEIGKHSVDYLICTHNDADHAKGLIGYLQHDYQADEVWLPGEWQAILSDVLKPISEIESQIIEDIKDSFHLDAFFHEQDEGNVDFEEFSNWLREHIESDGREESSGKNEIGPKGLDDAQEQRLREQDSTSLFGEVQFRRRLRANPRPRYAFRTAPSRLKRDSATSMFWSAIDAADRIRKIATLAFEQGAAIRWFEHFDSAAQRGHPALKNPKIAELGGTPALRPLNSIEIDRIPTKSTSLFHHLALTVENERSLAFWSKASGRPGVLFSADTVLDGFPSQMGTLDGAIVTAPHHGSSANVRHYKRVRDATNAPSKLRWVRSDSRTASRPCPRYLSVKGKRTCTTCNLGNGNHSTKQKVHHFVRNGHWVRHQSTSPCQCK